MEETRVMSNQIIAINNKIIRICIENCFNDILRQVCQTIYDRGEIEVYVEPVEVISIFLK